MAEQPEPKRSNNLPLPALYGLGTAIGSVTFQIPRRVPGVGFLFSPGFLVLFIWFCFRP